MAPQDSGPIIEESGRGRVSDDLALFHMTSGGEPMTPDDRCLRLEEIVIKQNKKLAEIDKHLRILSWVAGFAGGGVAIVSLAGIISALF